VNLNKLKIKSKSYKNNKTERGTREENEDIAEYQRKTSVKRKLKIKKKSNCDFKEVTEVENLVLSNKLQTIVPHTDSETNLEVRFSTEPHPLKSHQTSKPIVLDPPAQLRPAKENKIDKFSSFNNPVPLDLPKPPKKNEKSKFNSSRRGQSVDRQTKGSLLNNQEKNDIFKKWENEYGGIKDRKLVIKDDHQYNGWHTANNNCADDDIKEDIPEDEDLYDIKQYQKDVLKQKSQQIEESNGKSEFEYDWDGDESMSYIKKLADKHNKERYNKLASKARANFNYQQKPKESNEGKHRDLNKGNNGQRAENNDLCVKKRNSHFKSVVQQIDDWD